MTDEKPEQIEKLKKIQNDWGEAAKRNKRKNNETKPYLSGSVQNSYYLDIIKNNSPKEKSIWLDVCCGSGNTTVALSDLYRCFSIGFDISLTRLRIAQQTSVSVKANTEFVNADLFHLPFKENIFDGIISTQALSDYEITEQKNILQNLNNFLKPKGLFILSDASPQNNTIYNLLGMNTYLKILKNIGYSKIYGEGWGGKVFEVMWKFRNKILRKFLKKNSFFLNLIEPRFNKLLVYIGNLEKKPMKKSFFFHIVGIK